MSSGGKRAGREARRPAGHGPTHALDFKLSQQLKVHVLHVRMDLRPKVVECVLHGGAHIVDLKRLRGARDGTRSGGGSADVDTSTRPFGSPGLPGPARFGPPFAPARLPAVRGSLPARVRCSKECCCDRQRKTQRCPP